MLTLVYMTFSASKLVLSIHNICLDSTCDPSVTHTGQQHCMFVTLDPACGLSPSTCHGQCITAASSLSTTSTAQQVYGYLACPVTHVFVVQANIAASQACAGHWLGAKTLGAALLHAQDGHQGKPHKWQCPQRPQPRYQVVLLQARPQVLRD